MPELIFMLLVIFRPADDAPYQQAMPPIPFQTRADCEQAGRIVVNMAGDNTMTHCVEVRAT